MPHPRDRSLLFRLLVAITAVALCAAGLYADCPDVHVPTFVDGLAPLNELHIAPDGSNVTGDGSAANPYQTLNFAASLASPGSAIMLAPGTYPGGTFLHDLQGTPTHPIWIGGASPTDQPIIEGGSEGLHFVRCKYVIIQNLEVRNAANNGINADDGGDYDDPLASHHLLFQNIAIHDIGGSGNQDGLKLSGINEYFVLNCSFARCGGDGSGSGIDHVGCHHGLIAGCNFAEMSGSAIQCKGGSEDIEIRWCQITEGGERGINIGGSTGFAFFRPSLSSEEPNAEARDIRVVCNVIEGCTAAFAFVGCEDCVVSNNTIITPHNWLFRILQETTSTDEYEFLACANNRMENNLVYFDRSDLSTHVNIGPNTEAASFIFTSNLWYAYDNPAQSQPALPASETGGIAGVDPQLLAPADGDYQPAATSAAAGAAMADLLLSTDFTQKCYQCPAGIGAFEPAATSADLNHDGTVDLVDLLRVISWWGSGNAAGDTDGNGNVNLDDLLRIITDWNQLCWQ